MAKNRREFLGNSLKLAGASLAFVAFDDLYALEATTNTISPIKETTMNELTPTAKANLERLFGTSKLPQEDLEFFTNYANFAFDEVWEKSPLREHERLLIILASLVAIPAKEEFGTMLNAALNLGINPIAIKEVVYQATPYVGMGKIAEIVSLTNTIFKQRGIKLPLESQGTTNRENRKQKGLETQRVLFGEGIDKSNAAAPSDQRHIRDFLSANCFGDYYTRTGLELKFRELITFVYIASMGGAEPQLRAHIAGNLRNGNDRAKLTAVITALVPYIGYPRSLNALSAIDEIAK
nr:carboxymuconolactone decarboxylase family protein [Helicobacter pullorum]